MTFEFQLGNKIINYLNILHSPSQDKLHWKSMILDLEKMFRAYFGDRYEKFVEDTIGHLCNVIFEEDPEYDHEKHMANVKATIDYINSFSSGSKCEHSSSILEYKKFKKTDEYKTQKLLQKIQKLEKRIFFLSRLNNGEYMSIKNALMRIQKRLNLLQSMI